LVIVAIDQSRDYGMTPEVGKACLRTRESSHSAVVPHGKDPLCLDGECLLNMKITVHRDNLSVIENFVGRYGEGLFSKRHSSCRTNASNQREHDAHHFTPRSNLQRP
jgi:hypothetical protein